MIKGFFIESEDRMKEYIKQQIRRSQSSVTFEIKKGCNSVNNTLKLNYGLQNLDKFDKLDEINLGMAIPVDSTEDFMKLDEMFKDEDKKELFVSLLFICT